LKFDTARLAQVRRQVITLAVAVMLLRSMCPNRASAQAPAPDILLDAQLPDPLLRCISTERLQASYDALEKTHAEPAETRDSQRPLATLRVELRALDRVPNDVTQIELRAFRGAHALGVRVLPFRMRDCPALPDTLALVLQLLSRSAAPDAPAPPPEAGPPLQPIAAEAVDSPELPRPLPPARTSWGVGIAIGASFGALSRPAAALQVLAGLHVSMLELRLNAAFLWPQELAIAEGSVELSAYELALEACPTAKFDPWAVRLCFGPRFGIVRATSRGFAVTNRDAAEFSLYLGVLPELAVALSATTWLQLSGGVSLALQRPKFVLQFQTGSAPLALDGPAVLRADVGVSLSQLF
jgi:hypothetical protein